MANTVVGFDEQTAEKLLQVARRQKSVFSPPPNLPPEKYSNNVDYGPAQSTITARSGDTVGTGTVQSANRMAGFGSIASPHQYNDVKNPFDEEIASGTWCVIALTITNEWIIVSANC